MSPRSDPVAPPRAHLPFLALLAVSLLGTLALGWGTWGAPLVSEDSSAVAYVHDFGPFADFARTQYDLRTVRFWRPLVTFGLGLQEWLVGGQALGLRLANLLFHALAAALAGAIAQALGLRRAGAIVALAWALTFPFLGGTAHWVVGRVDSQCLPFVLACSWAALVGRPRMAALFALAALGTKESGAVAPAVATVLLLGRGDPPRAVGAAV
ncbi:MAG: hypothetical protein AAFZ65_13460, partial [Planctomycetota bacterium]